MKLLQRLSAWLLRTVQRAPAWAVFGLGALIALPFHLMGINALDQSYVFDAAGRISLGQSFPEQVSFPYGHVPIFIQAVIFKLIGISWSAYGLHAALANGLWMLICHRLTFGRKGSLVSDGSHWAVPLAAGAMLASAGLSLYCLAATPFPEHHAQLFLAAGLVVMLVENRLAPQRRALVAGILFALA